MKGHSKSSGAEAPKKMRFMPKIPVKKEQGVAIPKQESSEDVPGNNAELLNRVKQVEQGPGRRMPKPEKKSDKMEVVFGTVGSSFGIPKRIQKSQDNLSSKVKEDEDPWNYTSYYPSVLPLKLPYVPDEIDNEKFANPAKDLGLTEDKSGQMLVFQFPASLPLAKQTSIARKGKEVDSKRATIRERSSKLEELPAGYMGKLLVYKSGAVKMKLGDTLFDVSSGSDCVFAQDVMAINSQEKHCCALGELNKRAVVTLDLSSMVESLPNLDGIKI